MADAIAYRDPRSQQPLTLSADGSALVGPDGSQYPVVNGIPRFERFDGYASNFGLQWTVHQRTQLDSVTGRTHTRDRLERCLGGPVAALSGTTVLEAGCGAGRFTELLVGAGADVYAFDMTRAVDANHANIGNRPNYRIAQASVEAIPFPPASFDYVIALGMIQHTLDPERTIGYLYAMVKPGGRLVLDHYRWTIKYYLRVFPWMRLLIRRLEPELARRVCGRLGTLWFPLHWAARKRPFAAKVLRAISPCAVPDSRGLSTFEQLGRERAFETLVLDTFDGLADRYKHLRTPWQIRRTLERLGATDIRIGIGGNGVEASCLRPR